MRRNMCFFVMAGKHVNNIRAIARQTPLTTIEGFLEDMFSVEFSPRLYSKDPKLAACSSAESQPVKSRLGR
jgi:hypothetical protein